MANSPRNWGHLHTIRFDDRIIDVQAARVGATAPTFAAMSGGVFVNRFSGSQNDEIHILLQLPHNREPNTEWHPHVHWAPATQIAQGETVIWDMEYVNAGLNTAFSGSTTLDRIPYTAAVAIPALTHVVTEFTHINPVYSLIDIMAIRLSRYASGVGSDTFAGNVFLLGFDLHLELRDAGGSINEWSN